MVFAAHVSRASTTRVAEAPVERSQKPGYRADLQGLRAIASLLVAIYHTWFGTVSGGVDLFFVLTGLLISSTLVGNVERTGSVDAGAFLRRLAGRLLPMAGLVLVAVTIIVLVTTPTYQWGDQFGHVFAAATYWENWHLANEQTDYLARGSATSPAQHYWAMSVQGQFYLVCLLVVALAALLAQGTRRPTFLRWFGALVGAVTVLSLAWALLSVATNPVAAYFDTWARLWEFGAGALLFLLLRRIRLSARLRTLLGVLGLGLVLTAGLAPSEWPYPGPVALWPVTGALLVIAAHRPGVDAPGPATRILAWRPLVWIGDSSYGLYLWAWPLLMMWTSMNPGRISVPIVDGIVIIALAVLLGWASRRALELVQNAWTARGVPRLRNIRMPVAALLVPAVALVALVLPGQSSVTSAVDAERNAGLTFASVTELQQEIRSSLSVDEVPQLAPGFGDEGRAPEWREDGCATVTDDNLENCRYDEGADADREIFVIGDSQATSWLPGLREATPDDVAVQALGREMCPWSTADVMTEWKGVDAQEECAAYHDWVIGLIEERQPELVILTFGVWFASRVVDVDDGGMAHLAESAREPLERLRDTGADIVWLDSPPAGLNIDLCAKAGTAEQVDQFCASPVLPEQRERVVRLAEVAEDVGIDFRSTLDWFCDTETRTCPAFLRGMAVLPDGSHLSWAMSRALAPLLADELGLEALSAGDGGPPSRE